MSNRKKLAESWLKIWTDTLKNARTEKDKNDAQYWIGYFTSLIKVK